MTTPLFNLADSALAYSELINSLLFSIDSRLSNWFGREDYLTQAATVFDAAAGTKRWERKALKLKEDILKGDYGVRLEVRSGAELGGAYGAFSPRGTTEQPTIYLNGDWLATASPEQVEAVLIEELGHSFDQILNGGADSQGDEGEIFSNLVLNIGVDVTGLLQQNDHQIVTIDEQQVAIETATTTVNSISIPNGSYTVGSNSNIDVTVNFSGNQTVTTTLGVPALLLNIGGQLRNASYVSGSGSNNLVFRYTLVPGDRDIDGIAVVANSLQKNGGSINNGTDATYLNHIAYSNASATVSSQIALDVTPPTLASAVGSASTITLTFNEIGSGLNASNPPDPARFTLSRNGGTGQQLSISTVAINSQAQTVTLSLNGLINLTDKDLRLSYIPNGTNNLRDAAGNQIQSFTNVALTQTPPSFDIKGDALLFNDPVVGVGNGRAEGDIVVFRNAIIVDGQAIDVVVTTVALNKSTISRYDDGFGGGTQVDRLNDSSGSPFPEAVDDGWFKLDLGVSGATGNDEVTATIKFDFIKGGTYVSASNIGQRVILENVFINSYDLDGNISATNGSTFQLQEFGGFAAYTVSNGTKLNQEPKDGFTRFIGTVDIPESAGPGTAAGDQYRILALYESISSFQIKTGATNRAGGWYYLDFSKGPNWSAPAPTYEVPTVNSQTTNDTTPVITGTFIGTVTNTDGSLNGEQAYSLKVTVNNVTYTATTRTDPGNGGNIQLSGDNLTGVFNPSSGAGTWTLNVPTNTPVGTYQVVAEVGYGPDFAGITNQTYDVSTNELIIQANVAPVVDLNTIPVGLDNTVTFAEVSGPDTGANAVNFTSGSTNDVNNVTDVDSADLANLKVSIAQSNIYAGDQLRFGDVIIDLTAGTPTSGEVTYNGTVFGYTVTTDSGNRLINFTSKTGIGGNNALAPKASYEALVDALKYNNTSDNPSTNPRVFSVTANDGQFDSVTPAVLTVQVAPTPQSGSISGRVLDDRFGGSPAGTPNNQIDSNDKGIAGVSIKLTNAGPDDRFLTPDDIILTTTTDANGNYSFQDLFTGLYRVESTDLAGYTSLLDVDSGVGLGNPNSINNIQIANDNTVVTERNFLDRSDPGTISGFVFDNRFGNIPDDFDAGDQPISGVTVELRGAGADGVFGTTEAPGDDIIRSAPTGLDGAYSFTGLTPGLYRVTQTNLNGNYTDVADSDGSANGESFIGDIALGLGETVTGQNFLDTSPVPSQGNPNPSVLLAKSFVSAQAAQGNPSNGGDSQKIDVSGETISYTVTLQNTGNVPLTPTVTDPMFATNPSNPTGILSNPSGDAGVSGTLEAGETWTYNVTVGASDLLLGAYGNALSQMEASLPTKTKFVLNKAPLNVYSRLGGLHDSYFDGFAYDPVASGQTILDGWRNVWCVDAERTAWTNSIYTANVFSTYNPIITNPTVSTIYDPLNASSVNVDKPYNLDLVNWVLNQNYIGSSAGGSLGNYSSGDVQHAIWALIDNRTITVDLFDFNATRAEQIRQNALNFEKSILGPSITNSPGVSSSIVYTPGFGDKLAVLVIPLNARGTYAARQKLIVEVDLPAEGLLTNTATVSYDYSGETITQSASADATVDLPDPTATQTFSSVNLVGDKYTDRLISGNASDTLNGLAGRDILTGGGGADKFFVQFGQSLVNGTDWITDFTIGSDKIGLRTDAGGGLDVPANFTRAANATVDRINTTNLTTVVNSVFADANGAEAGNQGLGINSAALVQITATVPNTTYTYLVINDGNLGFLNTADSVIDITGPGAILDTTLSGATGLGTITSADFFVSTLL